MTSALIAPNILQVLKPESSRQKYQYKQTIKKLYDNKIIYLFGEKIELSKKGQDLIRKIQIEEINIKRSDNWNGIWHLVCYDIPEDKKRERDYFRSKLLDFGFKVIQDSLWVFPYECKEEIAIISQRLGISPYVACLNTDYLPQQNKLLNHFKLNINPAKLIGDNIPNNKL
jgi:DNA-binding transcriptional regulator PaaX